MTNATTKHVAIAIAIITVAALSSGCATRQLPSAHWVGDLAMEVPVEADVDAVHVVITGADMRRPAFARLEVEDGMARGTVQGVEAGEGRVVMVSAEMADGRRCARELRTAVDRNDTTALRGDALQCEAPHTVPAITIARAGR